MRKLVLLGCAVVGVACWDRVVAPEGPTYPLVLDTGPVRVDFCADSIPTWFAWKDGDSAWKTMVPDPAGTVEFTPTTNKIGIAFVQDGMNTARRRTTVWFVSSLEARHLTGANCVEGNGPVSLTVTLTGSNAASDFRLSIADSSQTNDDGSLSAQLSFAGLPARTVDVIASTVSASVPQKVAIRRDVVLSNGVTVQPVDLAAATAGTLVSFTPPTDFAGLTLTSRNGTTHSLSGFLPSSHLQIGDLHRMSFAAAAPCASGPCANPGARFAERFMYQGSALGVPIASYFASTPSITVASATPYLRPRLELPAQADYSTGVAVTVSNALPVRNPPFMRVVWTSAYLGAMPVSWDLTFPDLSAIAGWQPEYGIPYVPSDGAGAHTFAHVQAFAGRYPRPLPIPPHAGDALRWVEHTQNIP